MRPHPSEQAIKPIVEQVQLMLQSRASERGLDLRLEPHEAPAMMGIVDKARRRILVNLLTHVIEFTESGSWFALRWTGAEDEEEGGPIVRFEGEGTGTGVAPDQVACMFEEFVQIEDASGHARAGTDSGSRS